MFSDAHNLNSSDKKKVFSKFVTFIRNNCELSEITPEVIEHFKRCGFINVRTPSELHENYFGNLSKTKSTLNKFIQEIPLYSNPDIADLNAEIACLVSDFYSDILEAAKNKAS